MSVMGVFHAVPIWFTICVAVVQAVRLAIAGSRLEPERKNSRVNVMKTKVIPTAQACVAVLASVHRHPRWV